MSDAHVIANAPFEMRPFRENVPFAAIVAIGMYSMCVTRRDAGKIDINSGARGGRTRGAVSQNVSKSVRDGAAMGQGTKKKTTSAPTRTRRHAFCILPYEYVIRTSLDGFRLRRSRADKFTVNICSPP